MQEITIVVATGLKQEIGLNNKLLWHLPEDLKRFKAITSGGTIIMGRKTYESIGKPLPNRENIIITRNKTLKIPNCITVNSLDEAIDKATKSNVFVIGGEQIYNTAVSHKKVKKIMLTKIQKEYKADTFFPKLTKEWVQTQESKQHQYDNLNYSYIDYIKTK